MKRHYYGLTATEKKELLKLETIVTDLTLSFHHALQFGVKNTDGPGQIPVQVPGSVTRNTSAHGLSHARA
jgi:hypothetical protein